MIRHTVRACAAALLFVTLTQNSASGSVQRSVASDTVAFVRVNVVPMDEERILTRRAVLVAGGHIVALGSVDSIVVPASATRIDGGDSLFLLPGFADMHVHIRYETDLALLLANGITTVRNMRGTPFHLDLRARVANGSIAGPRIVTSGAQLRGDANSGATVANAIAVVDSQADAGYDFIKPYDGLPKLSYEAVVREAARRNLPVAGHIPAEVGLMGALRAKQASIEHVEEIIYRYFGDELDDRRIPEAARAIAAAHTYVTPTIAFVRSLELQWDDHERELQRPEIRYLNPETFAFWKTDRGHSSALNHVFEPFEQKLVRGMRDAGVKMLSGTDYYLFGMVAGFSLHRELAALVEAGLTPYEALETTTKNPAEYLGLSGTAGSVTVGKVADLVLIAGNPLVDIHNTSRRVGVMRSGHWHSATELDAQLDSIARKFAPELRLVNRLLLPGVGASLKANDNVPQFQRSTVAQIAASLLNDKRYADAAGTFALLTRRFPASPSAFDGLGDAYAGAGRKREAIQAYEHALGLDSSLRRTAEKLARLRGV